MGFPRGAVAARLSAKTQPFSREWLVQLAEATAKKAFDGAPPKLPAFIDKLDYDGYRDVRFRTDQALWREQNLPFSAQFFHLGSVYKRPIHVYEVADGVAREVLFETALFDYGKNPLFVEMAAGFRSYGLASRGAVNTFCHTHSSRTSVQIRFSGSSARRSSGSRS